MVVEPPAERRPAARALGATVVPACDPEAVRQAFDGRLADQVIVCTHNHAAMNDALHLAGPASVVQYFAPTPPGEMVPIDLGAIFWREVDLQSTYSAGPADIRDALAMLDERPGVLSAKVCAETGDVTIERPSEGRVSRRMYSSAGTFCGCLSVTDRRSRSAERLRRVSESARAAAISMCFWLQTCSPGRHLRLYEGRHCGGRDCRG